MDAMERLIKDHEYLTQKKLASLDFTFTSPCVNTAGNRSGAESTPQKTPGWMSFTFFTSGLRSSCFRTMKRSTTTVYRNANRFSTP